MKQRLEESSARPSLQKLLRVLCVLPVAVALLYGAYMFGPTFTEGPQNHRASSDDSLPISTAIPNAPNRQALAQAVLNAVGFSQLPIASGCDETSPEAFIQNREQEYRRRKYFSATDAHVRLANQRNTEGAGIFWRTVVDHHWLLGAIQVSESATVSPMLVTVASATPSCRVEWQTFQYTPSTGGARLQTLIKYHDPDLPVPPLAQQLFGFAAAEGAALEEYETTESVSELRNWYRKVMPKAWHAENLSAGRSSEESDSLIYFTQPGRYRVVALDAPSKFGETTILVVTGTL